MASEYLRKKAKKKAEEIEKKYGSSSYGGTTWLRNQVDDDDDIAPVADTSDSKASGYLREKAKEQEEALAAAEYEEYDKSPLLQAMYRNYGGREGWLQQKKMHEKTAANPEEYYDRTWFKSSTGNPFETILGTIADVRENLGTGLLSIGEAIVDGIAFVAPYFAQGQYYANGGGYNLQQDAAFNQQIESAKNLTADFIKKDIIDEEAIAKTIVNATDFGADSEAHSVLGEKSDALIQSGGQLIGQYAANTIAPGSGLALMGATAFGSEVENALQNGATLEEAGFSGLVSAGAEILSEKLGGISFGGKTLTDAAFDSLSRHMTSKLAKVLITSGKVTVDALAEGGEEVFSGWMSAIGQQMSYMEEKEIEELFSSEDALESFIGGVVLGGGSAVGGVVQSTAQGKDYVTGLTKNEQSVVDKVFKDELAKAEENGKVTNKQKNEIYNDIIERMEKGRIDTDTIEEVLGGDSFKAYKDILDSENALKEEQKALQEEQKALEEEYKQINPKNIRDMTGEEWDRREEIKARLQEIKTKLNEIDSNLGDAQTNAQRDALKAQLDNDVYELTKGDRLRESFFEVVRAKQKYQADLSQYKGRAKKVIQSVMESGLADNTNETHDFWDSMANMAEAMDTDITLADDAQILEMVKAEHKADGLEFDESKFKGQRIDGYISKNGIVLNAKTKRALNFVVGHEITHKLEKTKHYAKLQKLLFEYAKDEYERRFNERSGQYSNKFKADDKYKAKVDKEVTGDLVGDYVFNDKGFIDHLAKDRNVFQRVWDEIKYMAKIAKAGSEQAKQLERVKREFERAYRESNKNQSGTQNGAQFSVSETTDGRLVAVVDDDILSNIDTSSWDNTKKAEAKKAASDALKQFGDGIVVDGITRKVNRVSRREYTRSNYTEKLYKQSPDIFADKMRAADVADDIVVAATNWNRDGGLKHPRNDDFVDFDHGKTLIASGDAKYVAEVVVGITDTGEAVFYDVVDMQPTTFDIKKEESPTTATTQNAIGDIQGDSFSTNVTRKDTDVKMQFSVSDSDGKELSKGQQEYFKDSKMRDENGNLKVMYHGSQDAGFHVFNAEMSDDDTSFFFVDRNDVAASYSGTSETYEAKAFKTAEDANNFFESIGKGEYSVVEKDGSYALLDDGDEIATGTLDELYTEFCDYEGVGYGDANYKVYLNLTNPLVVDAEGRNWDNVTREFSQELADKYNSLTADEKAALSNLASWEDVGIFRDEIRQALADTETGAPGTYDEAFAKNVRSAYEKLGGNKVNMYDLFSIAEDNFSDLAIEAWAVKQMNTRDYAQKAKAEGYDGVIFKNIHDNGGYSNGSEGASTVAIAFNSNQIKSVANAEPTADPDIRYSLSDSNGRQLTKEQAEYFKDSKAVDENGSLKVVYHGTRNADFTVFKRNATYFTDNKSMADSYSPNGDMYEGYVNITKPYEIDAAGEKWSKIPIDDATRKFLQEYGASVFKEGGKWRTSPADIVSAIEEAVDNGDMDYDGIIIRNIDDTGSYYKDKDSHLATDYIVFNSNQFKNADNKAPTSDPDIRFSLSDAVEETKELVAVHNMRVSELEKSLQLGGLPMPSIAIIKAQSGHSEYGDVSLVFDKKTIDPQLSKDNKVYGGDAWTPVYPKIEYKPNATVAKKVTDLYYDIAKRRGYDEAKPLYNYAHDLEDELNRNKGEAGLIETAKDDTKLMQLYLLESGKGKVEPVVKEIRTELSQAEIEQYDYLINALGEDVINSVVATEGVVNPVKHRVEYWNENGEKIKEAYAKLLSEKYGFSAEEVANVLEHQKTFDYLKMIKSAYNYLHKGTVTTKTENDFKATQEAIREAAQNSEYSRWVDDLFKGAEEKSGIRNNKDYFTPSGNRRSFEALHWENNLENVVRVMKSEAETGGGALIAGFGIFGVSAKNYKSIADIKADSNRLTHIPEEEYKEIRKGFSARLNEICESIMDKSMSNPFIALDNACECVVDAVRSSKTKSGILNNLKQYRHLTVTETTVDDIVNLVSDIANMPTEYFEAKPRRAVGFDEVATAIIPDNASAELKKALTDSGVAFVEYESGNEQARLEALNSLEEYKFSLSDVGEQHRDTGGYQYYSHIPGSDIAPVQEDAAPIIEKPAKVVPEAEAVAPVEEEAAMFPDDIAPAQTLDELMEEAQDIMGAMEAYESVGDTAKAEQLMPEYEAVMERIGQMQRADAERVNSLDDADAPPERERYYDTQEDTSPIEKADIADIANEAKTTLALRSHQMADFRNLIEEYSKSDNPSRDRLFRDIRENFGTYKERLPEPTVAEAKKYLRTTKLYLSDTIIGDIADFDVFKKNNRRKVILSANGGLPVDSAYQELNSLYPHLFPESIINPTDQLLQMVDVANMSSITWNEQPIAESTLWEVTNDIADSVSALKRMQKEAMANEFDIEAFDNLVAHGDEYAPPVDGDIAPVIEESPVAEATEDVAPVAEQYEAIKPKRVPSNEPRMVRADRASESDRVANVLTEEQQAEKKKSNAWSMVKNNVLDKGMVFEDLSLATGNRELQARWNSIRYSEGKAQKLIGEGNAAVKSLNSIRETVEGSGKTKQFYEYLYHMHNIDRMTLEDRFKDVPNKAVFGDAVTADVSREAVAKLEQAYPAFKKWAQDVYDYNSYLRELLVDSGVISSETADLWEEMYPHYVPIRRAGDTGLNINVPLDTGRTGVNAPIKRATGGNSDILPLFDTMGQRTIQTYKAIAKNRFGVELKNTLGTTIANEATDVDEAIDSIDTQDGLLQEGKNGKSPTFTVFENGEKVTFEITDEMYDAMKPKSKGMAYTNKVANTISNIRRGTLTEYNPWFMLKNAVKDVQDILINSQHAARTYASIPEAIKQMSTKGHWYQEYLNNGGDQNTYFDNETATFKKDGALEAAKKYTGLNAISKANNVIEMMPRLAEYIASRKAGRSVDVSMLDAARVTTNFAAGGDLTKMLNRNGFTFLNASVQGAVQQARNIREAKANGLKGWANLATKYLVAGLPALLLNGLIWDDDEEYEELSDYVKENYYIVGKYGDGQFVRIPKGRTVAVIQNAFEQMKNAVTGDDEADLGRFLELVVSNLAPNNPIDNNILSPIVQVANNETWYGEDLVPTRLQDLPAAEQYDESTDALSRWLGETFDISPYKVNYLLDQYSGVIGDTFLPMMTPEAESGDNSILGNMIAPLKDMFTTDSVMNNQNVSDFYDTKDELTVNANASGATDEDVLMSKYMNAVNAELAELYKQKREIQNSDMSDSRKYAKVRDIQQQIIDLTKNGLNTFDDVSFEDDYREGGEYARIGDMVFKKDDDGEWGKLSDEQLTKYEVTKAAGDASYATDGENHYRWYVPGEDSDAEPGWKKITEDQLEKQEEVTKGLGISPEEYWNDKDEYDYAYKNPGNYAVAKAVGGYDSFKTYSSDLYDIKADKDSYGKSISGSRKEKVIDYINGLDADYGEKIILFKSEYKADDTYNMEIIEYLNGREDISYEEMETILKELGFNVDSKGNITWD